MKPDESNTQKGIVMIEKTTALLKVLVLLVSLLVLLNILLLLGLRKTIVFNKNLRYDLVSIGGGGAYQVDKETGDVWLVTPEVKELIPHSTPEPKPKF